MADQDTHINKQNYTDVYFRCAVLGFIGFLKDKFFWNNESEEQGTYKVELPIFYSLTGDNRYVSDAFYDDIPDKRVNMNTDQIPRGIVTLTNINIKAEEFTNPNIWLNINTIEDEELIQISAQVKAVPIKLTFTLDTVLNSEIDVFKCWQTYMENLWMYKYFTFDYKRIPINAVFNFVADTENPIARDFNYGTSPGLFKTTYNIEVNTFFPIFDLNNKVSTNGVVNFVNNVWHNTNNNLPPSGGSIT